MDGETAENTVDSSLADAPKAETPALDVVVTASAPNSQIIDEYQLPFAVNDAFLREQQMLYAQLSGRVRNDAHVVRQQQEALAKLGINESNKENNGVPNAADTSGVQQSTVSPTSEVGKRYSHVAPSQPSSANNCNGTF